MQEILSIGQRPGDLVGVVRQPGAGAGEVRLHVDRRPLDLVADRRQHGGREQVPGCVVQRLAGSAPGLEPSGDSCEASATGTRSAGGGRRQGAEAGR